jgi:hypothetical protein
MAGQPLTSRPEATEVADNDLFHVVSDPAGTPVSKKVSKNTLLKGTKPKNLCADDLSATTSPHALTVEETTDKVISNYSSTGADRVFTLPTAHENGSVIFCIGDEFQVDIEPPAGTAFFLNGTEMAADEHIQNTVDTIGDTIVFMVANVNGTLRWMARTSDANWVEETP